VGRARRGPPDLVVEKQWLAGEIDQLELYRRLGVREVWLWDAKRIHRHRLVRGGAVDADLPLLERCLRMDSQAEAVKLLRAALKH
jgi:Uma2 family endonuclease